jgi:multiple sugar transport system permease protein/sn-glycerol 3-phosphate transport system permease protein
MSAVSAGRHARMLAATPSRLSRLRGHALAPYLYAAPLLGLILLFTYWPLFSTFGLSLERWNLNPDEPVRFVGAENFQRLFGGELFRDAALNTAWYLLAALPLLVLLPIPVAIAIWALGRSAMIYRTLLFLPTLLSFVVISIAFVFLLNPLGGAVPAALAWLGFGEVNPLADPLAAFWTILAIASWKVLGFNVLIYLAGLSRIRSELIDAMRVDGASAAQIVRHLVWPLLTPSAFLVLVSTVIFTMQQVFTPIDILTGGGPRNGTTNLFYMVYQLTFRSFDMGQGAAGTVLIFILLLGLTLLKFAVLDRRVHYLE